MANNDYIEDMMKLSRKRQMSLTKKQEREIYTVYANAMNNYADKFMNSNWNTATGAMYSEYAQELAYNLQDIINKYSIQAATNVTDTIEMVNSMMFQDNLLKPSYGAQQNMVSKICRKIGIDSATQIIRGDIYKDGRGLSSRIWKSVDASCHKIENVIAQGMAQQLSAVEMSKMLKSFMNPGAITNWDRQKIKEKLGPGYAAWNKDVAYEALRLARTTITHSATLALKESAKVNPYLDKVIWHSVHALGRTCAECKERDGKEFTPKNVPFDHPNGICWQELTSSKELSQITDELKDWIHGAPNPKLDKWESQMHGLAKKNKIKDEPVLPKAKEKEWKVYTKSDIDALDQYSKKQIEKLKGVEKDSIEWYTGSGYSDMNRHLRFGQAADNATQAAIKHISNSLAKVGIPNDMKVYRGCDLELLYHAGMEDVYEKMLLHVRGQSDADIKKQLIGETFVDQGFMSTSVLSTNAFNKKIKFEIEVDQDYPAAFIKPLSRYKHEEEVLLDKGTGLFIKDVKFNEDQNRWDITAKAVH